MLFLRLQIQVILVHYLVEAMRPFKFDNLDKNRIGGVAGLRSALIRALEGERASSDLRQAG